MPRLSLVGLTLVTLTVGGLTATAGAAEEPARWLTDYEAARSAARAAGKPIFLVFR
jgi:hypothetical protein